ncbi:MAG: cob(I)yrinic acid a,c-diamide adenosyltransferase [Thermoanaerobaculales bacterium]|nr:cob(I)yrinic acid a,c-diamide adenosyltransferase [Thermoanaerobaculales bacterium]
MKIYTKTGDGGETSLYSGGRVGKDSPRIEAYGTVDELNSVLGVLLAEDVPDEAADRLREVQSDLFSMGSVLADPKGKLDFDGGALATDGLEAWIDAMEEELPELRSFILPGGCREAALAHVARSVCRRAERRVLAVDGAPAGVVPYLNRLSDALFVLARWFNLKRDIRDVEWRP